MRSAITTNVEERKLKYIAAVLLVLFATSVHAAGTAPTFSDYKVNEIYKGKKGKIKTEPDDDPKFKRALIEAGKGPVNFAGHYTIFHFSCGLGSICASVLDVITGDVVARYPDMYDVFDDNATFSDDYRPDSRLVIITGMSGQTDTPLMTRCYVFGNNAFDEIKCK